MGFVSPVTIEGRNIMRELSLEHYDWDTPLPAPKQVQWKLWRDSMEELVQFQILRCYVSVSLAKQMQYRELCAFSDVSNIAIAAAAYLKTVSTTGDCQVGFIMGKSKLAPRPAHTMPHLELCAAVFTVELADFLKDELDIDMHAVKFYTDSKIVLGYIYNTSRRFYVYVSNRVVRIRKSSHPHHWSYVNIEENPTDHGTRPVTATALKDTNWFSRPLFMSNPQLDGATQTDNFVLVHPVMDQEIRPEVTTFVTKVTGSLLGSHRFERFSTWRSLTRAVFRLIQRARTALKTPIICGARESESAQATTVIIKAAQQDFFSKEVQCLSKGDTIPKQSKQRWTVENQWPHILSRLAF